MEPSQGKRKYISKGHQEEESRPFIRRRVRKRSRESRKD